MINMVAVTAKRHLINKRSKRFTKIVEGFNDKGQLATLG